MKWMTFKKAFLLGGIFLLATFMLAQLSWGCDDKDKWDCDHHDKWDCHKYGSPCYPPKIQSVDVKRENKEIVIDIYGENFDNGVNPPVVSLAGTEIVVSSYNGREIEARFDPSNFPDSDYRLVVSTCHDPACQDKYCKDHGPYCKCKYCKEHCSKCRDKYCKDHEYKCRCKDRYSLTIPGPSGAPAEKGIITSRVVEVTKTVTVTESTPISDPNFKIEGTASCNELDTNVVWTVTGGGFSSSRKLSIDVSTAVISENGWYVVGTPVPSNIGLGDTLEIKIHAVCATIQ